MPAFNRENLLDDFMDAEITLPTFESTRAEAAAVSATDLGGNAERVAIAGFAVKRRVRGD